MAACVWIEYETDGSRAYPGFINSRNSGDDQAAPIVIAPRALLSVPEGTDSRGMMVANGVLVPDPDQQGG